MSEIYKRKKTTSLQPLWSRRSHVSLVTAEENADEIVTRLVAADYLVDD